MRSLFVFIVVLSLSGCGLASWVHDDVDQTFTKTTFTEQALLDDLDYLKSQMEARHPVYAQLVDVAQLEQGYVDIKGRLKSGMTRRDFFREVGKVNPFFRDGHSFIFPLLAEGQFTEEQGNTLFPFYMVIKDQSLYFGNHYRLEESAEEIRRGSRLLSINGQPADTLLAELTSYGHGETTGLRMHMSTLLFPYWLNALYEFNGRFELEIESDGIINHVSVTSEDNWQSDTLGLGDNYLKFIEDNTAYLRLGTFDVDEDADFDGFVEESFAKIKQAGTSQLIIDVRGNTGGQTDAGAKVISYLTNREISPASKAIERLTADTNGLFGYKGNPGDTIELDVASSEAITPADASERFTGNTVVLIDEMTYSASIVFATTIQDHNLATIVGRPTGGHANQTGNLVPFYLPNTKLLVLAPSRYITRVSGDTRKLPVLPDIEVDSSADTSEDKALAVAREVLGRKI